MLNFFKTYKNNKISCKGWQQEGLLRLLLNCLDPDIAKKPEELIAYGGRGKVARNISSFKDIINFLKELENDETLVVQSGKPMGIFKTHKFAPRVIMAGALIVPHWSNWDYFQKLEEKGLTAYGQSTAGSWSYIGTQGILQGTWETFYQVAKRYFDGSLKGKLILTSGLGEMGSAQPLAITAHGGVAIVVDVNKYQVKKRLKTSIIDVIAQDIDEALDLVRKYVRKKEPLSIGYVGNASEVFKYFVDNNIMPDIVTDQTPAHDIKSYIPAGFSVKEAISLGESNFALYKKEVENSIKQHVNAMIEFKKKGAVVFDYGNNIREQGYLAGIDDAFLFPGFAAEYIRPLFCEGRGPFRWIALSGDPEDIYKTDELVQKLFPYDEHLRAWIEYVQKRFSFYGLPARVCWLNCKERVEFGISINKLVKEGELKAPIAITRDHMDAAAVASPFRETEGMKDGSDAIADWPVLNAILNGINGATLVGVYQGGGVGIGYSIHSGMTVIADGSDEAELRLKKVLRADSELGLVRYADAGYDDAKNLLESLRTAKNRRGV